jgi:hypothetical protein
MNDEFEREIRERTTPIEGKDGYQYPRPWMTKLQDPLQAKVFIVGMNQAKAFLVDRVGSHDRFINALFNRNGESCRGLYDEVTGDEASPTRDNIDDLVRRLEKRGVREILETNVICYSTPMSSHLRQKQHRGGKARGDAIFRALLCWCNPAILIAHGSGTRKRLGRVLSPELPPPPAALGSPVFTPVTFKGKHMQVVVIPSLALPGWNCWRSWADDYLDAVAAAVGRTLSRRQQ